MKAFEYLLSQPLLCTIEAAEAAADVALRVARDGPHLVEARPGSPRNSETGVTDRDGVRTINVIGPVFRYADMMTELCGGMTLEALARDFHAAIDSPSVSAVLLNIDSPGGEAAGVCELSSMVRAACSVKPVETYIGNLGASAMYWVAAATSKITIAPTASVGSIGVVSSYPIRNAKDKERSVEFVSSQSPNKRPDMATDEGRAVIQSRVNDLADLFIDAVAEYRNVSRETVIKEFGCGGVLMGSKAVAAGMADAVGSYEGTLAELAVRGRTGQLAVPRSAPKTAPVSDPMSVDTKAARRTELLSLSESGREILARENAGKPPALSGSITEVRRRELLMLSESGRATLEREDEARAAR